MPLESPLAYNMYLLNLWIANHILITDNAVKDNHSIVVPNYDAIDNSLYGILYCMHGVQVVKYMQTMTE